MITIPIPATYRILDPMSNPTRAIPICLEGDKSSVLFGFQLQLVIDSMRASHTEKGRQNWVVYPTDLAPSSSVPIPSQRSRSGEWEVGAMGKIEV